MKNILKVPLWLFELVTTAKSFSANPLIGSSTLNRMGLHVVRLIVSHAIMYFRMILLSLPLSAEDRKSFFRNGYILKENFLSDEDFLILEKEVKVFKGEVREARQGDTLTQRAVLSPDVLKTHPKLDQFIASKKLIRLIRFASGSFRAPFHYLEEVKNKYCEGKEDPQKMLHMDTFHPSMKFWYFIEDVTEEMGPFSFVPYSHKLTWKRIKWHFRMSLTAKNADNVFHSRGSTRFTSDDLDVLGLPAEKAFTVSKNTLLVVNVFGIHRRGDSTKKSTRLALWGDSRTNPFIPFPGIGGDFVNRMQYYFLEIYRQKADERAEKNGFRSPWKVINQDTLKPEQK